jgi:hypothetical protein
MIAFSLLSDRKGSDSGHGITVLGAGNVGRSLTARTFKETKQRGKRHGPH